jgi:hypothetical protein
MGLTGQQQAALYFARKRRRRLRLAADTIDYSEFPPEDFYGAALVGLFKADGAGLVHAGGIASSWACEITGRTLTAAGSPTVVTGLNGKPCVRFNGTDQRFFATAALPGTWPVGTAEGGIFAFASQDGGAGALDTATRALFSYGTSTAGAARELDKVTIGGSASRFRTCRTSAGAGLTDTSVLFDGPHIVGARYEEGGTNFYGRIDGADANPASAATGFNTSGSRSGIGCDVSSGTTPGSHWKGDIYEIHVLAAVTEDQRELGEGYFAWKFGV